MTDITEDGHYFSGYDHTIHDAKGHDFYVDDGITAEHAIEHCFFNPFLHCGNVLTRDHPPHDLVLNQ